MLSFREDGAGAIGRPPFLFGILAVKKEQKDGIAVKGKIENKYECGGEIFKQKEDFLDKINSLNKQYNVTNFTRFQHEQLF